MIHIEKDKYIDPNRLLLVEGDIEGKSIQSDLADLACELFKEEHTPDELIQEFQDINHVDYNKMYPITGGICLSDACQLRCNYCSFSSNEMDKKIVKLEDVKVFVTYLLKNIILRRLLDKKKEEVLDIYLAGGGEPTYSWNLLVNTVEYIKEKATAHNIPYTLGITTNGVLNKDQVDYIIENFNMVALSFDGLPDIHNENRKTSNGTGSFEIIKKALDRFNERKYPLILRTTIWPKDYDKLCDMVKYVCENYKFISSWAVEPVNARGRATDNNEAILSIDFYKYYIKAKEMILNNNYRDVLICGKFKDNVVGFMCGTSFGVNPWLIPNGSIISCLDAKSNATVVAQITDGNIIKNIFKDELITTYIKNRKKCDECFAFKFCGGGCPLKYVNQDEIELIHDDCEMIRKYWKYIFNKILNDEDIFGWTSKKYSLEKYPSIKIRKIWRETWQSV